MLGKPASRFVLLYIWIFWIGWIIFFLKHFVFFLLISYIWCSNVNNTEIFWQNHPFLSLSLFQAYVITIHNFLLNSLDSWISHHTFFFIILKFLMKFSMKMFLIARFSNTMTMDLLLIRWFTASCLGCDSRCLFIILFFM